MKLEFDMKLMVDSVCQTSARAVLCLAFLALAGCSLPLPDKPMRPRIYDLGPPLSTAADAPPDAAALALDAVMAPTAIAGTQIIYRLAYSDSGQQPRPYAQARWAMTPPQLVGQRLRETLSARRPVVDAGTGLAPLELRAELDEFAHVFTAANASEGVVRLRVTAIAPATRGNRLLGQRSFTVRQPAASNDAAGAAAALRAATDEVARQVTAWVDALPAPH
jgi:cholesterol transport system auxiliary component